MFYVVKDRDVGICRGGGGVHIDILYAVELWSRLWLESRFCHLLVMWLLLDLVNQTLDWMEGPDNQLVPPLTNQLT